MSSISKRLLALALMAGCGTPEDILDAGSLPDAGTLPDAGSRPDAGASGPDAGELATDAGALPADAGPRDGGAAPSNEPPGMTVQIDTGPITSFGASGLTMYSPSTKNSYGEWSGNLTSPLPDGTGIRIHYDSSLVAGNSPVRAGRRIPSSGTGWYFQRWRVRFSPNWTTNGNPCIKMCEPQSQEHGSGAGATSNPILGGWTTPFGDTRVVPWFAKQGPNASFANYGPASAPFVLSDGNWHTWEILLTPESNIGAADGKIDFWVDAGSHFQQTHVQFLTSGMTAGWPFWLMDPVYGGVVARPPTAMWWDWDQLYVSTR